MTYEYITDTIINQVESIIIDFKYQLKENERRIVGCSEEEIEKLEKGLPSNFKLPRAYKEFLDFGGQHLADIYNAMNFSYREAIFWQKNSYEDIEIVIEMSDESFTKMPENIFVLNEHLGASFTFFKLDEGDNPPVYFWKENVGGLETAKKKYESFTVFLEAMISSSRKLLE